jgi:selenide, water dikinase
MAQVLRQLPAVRPDPNLLVGTETSDDAGVYLLAPGVALVQTVDFFAPVVDDPFAFGQIAAANALSDIYAMGGTPKTALNLAAFPDDRLPLATLSRILAGGGDRLAAAGAALLGGHTIRDAEVKYGVAVTGVVDPAKITTNAAARPGDVLYLTKPLGTGFVTTAAKRRRCPEVLFAAAVESMVALNAAAAAAGAELGVRAATDITGYGLAGHALEMAQGSGVTLAIELDALPILPGAEALVAAKFFTRASATNRAHAAADLLLAPNLDRLRVEFLFDPQTSGGLLLAVPAARAAEAAAVFARHSVAAARIGLALPRGPAALTVGA